MTPARRSAQTGQNLIEFSIALLLLMIIFLGIMDFSYLFSGYVSAHNAVRGAARFAATHPSSWTTNSNPPDRTTIEGNLKLTAVPAVIPNDDSHVTINYVVPISGSSSGTKCGHYLPSSGYSNDNGYAQITCVTAGHLVQIKATYVYTFMTPMLSRAFTSTTIQADALEFIEG